MTKVLKYVIYLLCLFLLTAAVGGDFAQGAEKAEDVFKKADALFEKKKFSEALSLYEKVVSLDPVYVRGYRGIVRCYSRLGDPEGAVIFMEGVFLEDFENAAVCYGMGYALYNTKKYDKALGYFEKSIKLNPDLAAAWNNRAAIFHFIKHDYKKARKYYEKAIAVSRKTGNNWVRQVAQQNLDNLPTEEETKPLTEKMDLEKFMNLFISRVDEKNDRAMKMLVLGQKDNAELAMEWFLNEARRHCAQGRKEDENTTVLLATLLEKHFRKNFQSDFLQNKLELYKSLDDETKKKTYRGEQLLVRGVEAEQKGDFAEARQSYQAARELFESTGDKSREGMALVYLGDACRGLKDYGAARDAYSKGLTCYIATRQESQKALALSSLGIACYLLGEHSDALNFLKRSLKAYRLQKDEATAQKVERNIQMIEQRMKKK